MSKLAALLAIVLTLIVGTANAQKISQFPNEPGLLGLLTDAFADESAACPLPSGAPGNCRITLQQILNTPGSAIYAPLSNPTFPANANVSGSLGISGTLNAAAAANINGTLGVLGTLNAFGAMNVTGNTTINGQLSVVGNTTFGSAPNLSGPVVNVMNPTYGAKCDGSADDATAINAALSAGSGKTVFFPPSSTPCMIGAAPLTVPSNTTLFAYPGTTTLKLTASNASNPGMLYFNGVSNVLVYGLTLDGNLAGVPSANPLNQLQGGISNVVFDHVTVQNTRGIGISFSTGITNSGVRQSVFNNVGNYFKTSGLTADQKQGVTFCCGISKATSAGQGSPGPTISFSSTTGIVSGMLVAGTSIPTGATVASVVANTSVTLTANTTLAVLNGATIFFYSNQGNFVIDSSFTSIGLDAISIADEQDFLASNDYCYLAGGQNSNGGACIYASNGHGLKVHGVRALNSLGNGIDLIQQDSALIEASTAYKSSSRGIAVDTSNDVVVSGNHAIDNQQYTTGNGQGGINISGTSTNITITGNDAHDDQATQTQPYGIGVNNGAAITNLYIDPSNLLAGNLTGEVGGGYGAEGVDSVDLQRGKTNLNFAAYGQGATISGGFNNTAGGASSSIAGGYNVTTLGSYSFGAGGEWTNDRFRSLLTYGTGFNANSGDAQVTISVLRASTTSVSQVFLQDNGGFASTANNSCVNLPNIAPFSSTQTSVYGLDIDVVAIDTASGGNLNHYHDANATLYRTGNAATTTFTAGSSPLNLTIGSAGTISITADTSNSCIKVGWTAPNTHAWHVVSRVIATEAF